MRSDVTHFYNQTTNPVDLTSTDFVAVMAYLRSYGLPDPLVTIEEAGMPFSDIRWTDIELVYTSPSRPPLKMQAFLVMNAPQRAVTDYDLWSGRPEPRIPPEYAPVVIHREDAKPEKPVVLVGACIYANRYLPVTGDDSPDGTKYTDERGNFVKHMIPTPFGRSVYWEKV